MVCIKSKAWKLRVQFPNIGYEEGGPLTRVLKKRSYSVILLDEVEISCGCVDHSFSCF